MAAPRHIPSNSAHCPHDVWPSMLTLNTWPRWSGFSSVNLPPLPYCAVWKEVSVCSLLVRNGEPHEAFVRTEEGRLLRKGPPPLERARGLCPRRADYWASQIPSPSICQLCLQTSQTHSLPTGSAIRPQARPSSRLPSSSPLCSPCPHIPLCSPKTDTK